MARITALRAAFRGSKRRSIIVDDEEWKTTSLVVVRELGLGAGDEIDLNATELAIAAAEPAAARERALRLLGYREHGSSELRDKLVADGYPDRLAQETVAALMRIGLVDDVRYAEVLARTLIDGRRYGRSRARTEMVRRGVDETLVQEALDACCPESGEYDRALAMASHWARPGGDTRKLAARLARRGFPPRICFDAAAAALGDVDTPSDADTL